MAKQRPGYAQISLFMPHDVHRALKSYTGAIGSNVTEWINEMARQKMIETGYFKPDTKLEEYESLSQLLQDRWDLIEANAPQTKMATLEAIKDGKNSPTEVDVVRIAAYLDIDELEIVTLIKKERKTTNGNV